MATWKEVAAKHRARVPRGSTFAAYQNALKSASREYRGLSKRASSIMSDFDGTSREENPIRLGESKTIILLLVGGYLAYTMLVKKAAPPPADAEATRLAAGYSNMVDVPISQP